MEMVKFLEGDWWQLEALTVFSLLTNVEMR